MGLMDVIRGMENGPHAPRTPGAGGGGGGMSPITMAILGLIAYKALKSLTSHPGAPPSSPAAPPASPGANPAGGLGDLLKGGLGGLLGGAAAGSVLTGGLNDLLRQFQQAGQGDVAKSWVDNGPNKSISPEDLAKALGADQISTLMSHTGMSREELLSGLSRYLPGVIDQLTPHGRLPTEQEMARAM